MEVAKLLFILYTEVCASICTVQLISFGFGKLDKYITNRRKAKEEANKLIEVGSKALERLEQVREKMDIEEFRMMVQKDSEEYRESARQFIENSKKFQEECQRLLAKNDEHIQALMKMNQKEGAK